MSILKRLKTPVFKAEGLPEIDEQRFMLQVGGLVEEQRTFTLEELHRMRRDRVEARLVSVSGFSIRTTWEGVLWSTLAGHLKIAGEARFALFRSAGGYHTSLPLDELDHPRLMLAFAAGGEPLEREYGAPLRLLVPHLWGYKSCKWLAQIYFTRHCPGGYWEERGYSYGAEIAAGYTYDLNSGRRRYISGGEVTDF